MSMGSLLLMPARSLNECGAARQPILLMSADQAPRCHPKLAGGFHALRSLEHVQWLHVVGHSCLHVYTHTHTHTHTGLLKAPTGVCLLQVLMVVFDILLSHHRMTKWHEQRVQQHLQDMAVLQAAVAQQEERLHSHAAASTSQVRSSVGFIHRVGSRSLQARPCCAFTVPGQQLKQCSLTAALRVSSVVVAVAAGGGLMHLQQERRCQLKQCGPGHMCSSPGKQIKASAEHLQRGVMDLQPSQKPHYGLLSPQVPTVMQAGSSSATGSGSPTAANRRAAGSAASASASQGQPPGGQAGDAGGPGSPSKGGSAPDGLQGPQQQAAPAAGSPDLVSLNAPDPSRPCKLRSWAS